MSVTTPEDDESAEPVILENDDQDTVAQTRALPEVETTEQDRVSPEQLPTIGHVGRYALKYCIGEGGLGTVYAAHDPLLSRLIAIKTMQVDLPDQDREQFNALFLNEAKAAGSLNHPHIVTVYDAGAGSQGTYMAMELLRGKDLRQLLSVGWRPTPAQAALILRRVADAVSYAHHKGVVHRDLKPANIFMVGRTQPRVLDFGIARIRQVEAQAPASDEGLSRFGDVVGGSPHYMAPEQVRREPADRRADVYSLGVVLYELLTGRKPFGGNDLDEISDEVLNKAVRPPHESNPEVPEALSMIAMRAMTRDLVQRTRSARTLSQELREWLDSQDDDASKAGGKADKSAKNGKAARKDAAAKAAQALAPTQPVSLDEGSAFENKARQANLALIGALVVGMAVLVGGGLWAWQKKSDLAAQQEMMAAALASEQASAASAAALAQAASEPVVEVVESPSLVAEAAQAGAASAAVAEANLAAAAVAAAPVSTVAPATAVAPGHVLAPVAAEPAKPVPTGTVKLAVSPWGRVFVGRKAMGVTPPLNQLTLPQGRHTVIIRNDDFPPYQQTIEVKAGQSVSVSHAF
jgi:serine/threonine-protein kinase